MKSRLWRMVAIGGVAAVVIAGCGSGASDKGQAPPKNPKNSSTGSDIAIDNGAARIQFHQPAGWTQTNVARTVVSYSNNKNAELAITLADSPAFQAEKDPQRRLILAIPEHTQKLPQACLIEQPKIQVPGAEAALALRFENPCGTPGKRALDAIVDNQHNKQPLTDIAPAEKVSSGLFLFFTESHNQVATVEIASKKTDLPESQIRDIENSLRIESLTNFGKPVAGAILPRVNVKIGHKFPVPPADPCAALTKDDAQKINPVVAQQRIDSASGKQDTCSYQFTDTTFIDFKTYAEPLANVLQKYLPNADITGTGKIGEFKGNTSYSWRASPTQSQTLWVIDDQHTALISFSAQPGTLNVAMDARTNSALTVLENRLSTHQ